MFFTYKLIHYFSLLAILIVFMLILNACNEQTTKKKRAVRTLPIVEVVQAEVQSLNQHFVVSGTLEAIRTIHFYNQAEGLLQKLPFHEGDLVKKGQLLAQLDNTIIKADYNKTQANLKQTRIDYQRLEKLATSNHTSKELLTRARTKVTLDQADYNLQKQRLSYTEIKAPWDGVISERLVEPGDVLSLHTHFSSLIDASSLIVKIPVSELSLNKININDPIRFSIDSLGKKQWSGNILRIYPHVNSQTRKGMIEVKLHPVPQGARPGQLSRIHLITKKEDVLVIPLSAIRYDQQGGYVFSITTTDKNVHKIARSNIITGNKYPELIEVLEGLKAGDSIVKKGLFGLSSGKKVRVLENKVSENND